MKMSPSPLLPYFPVSTFTTKLVVSTTQQRTQTPVTTILSKKSNISISLLYTVPRFQSSTTHITSSTVVSNGSVNTGSVVGAVVGGVLMFLLILTVVMVCVVVRYRRKHSSSYDKNMYLLRNEGKTV